MSDAKPEVVEEGKTEDVNMEEVKDEKPVAASNGNAAAKFDEPLPKIEGLSEEEVQSLLSRAAKQVNFYFSDSNLPVDKYFFTLTACNEDGWVPIKTINTFTRMREFGKHGVPFVVYAIKQFAATEGSDPLLLVSDDGENVRRVRKLEPVASAAWNRTVYVKGFGEGANDNNTQEKLEAYFEQFGKMNAVRKRMEDVKGGDGIIKKGKGPFKGSVFAEFADEEDMKKFLEREEIPKFLEDGSDMIKMTKEDYVQMKMKEKGISHTIFRGSDDKPANGGASKGNFKRNELKFNAFREMEKLKAGGIPSLAKIPEGVAIVGERPKISGGGNQDRDNRYGNDRNKRGREEDDDEDGKPSKVVKTGPVEFTYNGVKLEIDRETGKIVDTSKVPFEDGHAIKMVGTSTDPAEWKALKAEIAKTALPKVFLACPPGAPSASVCNSDNSKITDEDIEKLKAADIKYGGKDVEWVRMTEEEQRNFWSTRATFQGNQAVKALKAKEEEAESIRQQQQQANQKSHHKGGKDFKHGGGGRGGGRGRGGRGGGRGGRGGNRQNGGGRDGNESKADTGGMPPMVHTAKAE